MASQAQLGIGSSSSDPHAGQPHTVMQRRSKIVATGVSFQQRLSVFSAGNDFEIEGIKYPLALAAGYIALDLTD